MFIVRKKKAKVAHYWTGRASYCRMYSTGGMNKRRYKVVESSELPICRMCEDGKTGHLSKRPPPSLEDPFILVH